MSKMAVIKTGGKQYLVKEGDMLSVEKLSLKSKDGKISFDEVLLVDDGKGTKVGDPSIKGTKVTAEIMDEGRGRKVTVIRYRAKSRYFKKKGHRQPFSKVKIVSIA